MYQRKCAKLEEKRIGGKTNKFVNNVASLEKKRKELSSGRRKKRITYLLSGGL
jgi:hypothetical protein